MIEERTQWAAELQQCQWSIVSSSPLSSSSSPARNNTTVPSLQSTEQCAILRLRNSVEPQANLEVVWHGVELVHMVHLFLVSHINHLTPLLRQLGLHIPQPSGYANTYSCQFLNLLDETTCVYKRSTVHVGVLDGDGGLLSEGVLEDEVLLLSLAGGRCPAAHSTTGGGPVSGCGGGAGGDTQLPLSELLHVLDLLKGDAAVGGREAGISEKA